MEKIDYLTSNENLNEEILKKKEVGFLINEFGFHDEYSFVSAIVGGYKEENNRNNGFYKRLSKNQKLDFIRASTSISSYIDSESSVLLLRIVKKIIETKILDTKKDNVLEGKNSGRKKEKNEGKNKNSIVTMRMMRDAKFKSMRDLKRSGGVNPNEI